MSWPRSRPAAGGDERVSSRWEDLERYPYEFAGRHNIRHMDTLDQMAHVVTRLIGKRLLYRELVA